jgi:hypothetical protein
MNQNVGSASSRSITQTANKFKYYPLVAVLCWVAPTIVRIGDAFGWSDPTIDGISQFMSYFQGFLDAVVYFSISSALKEWRKSFAALYYGTNVTVIQQLTVDMTAFMENHQDSSFQTQTAATIIEDDSDDF